jgi:hypothetical protein
MIDNTLSMSEVEKSGKTKMDYMKETVTKMVEYMSECDATIYVSICTFNTEVEFLVIDTLLDKTAAQAISEKIRALDTNSSTNIQNALETTVQMMARISEARSDRQLAHIFMTDGEANVGIVDLDALSQLVNESYPNVFIGFGANHNSEMLRKFGKIHNSDYYFVDNLENSVLVYAESIHNILYGVLPNVEFYVENGQLYNFETNQWCTVLYENMLSSDSHKFYQLKTNDPENVRVRVSYRAVCELPLEWIDTATPLPELCDETGVQMSVDLTKYAFRQKVQECMFLATDSDDDIHDLLNEVFGEIKKYTNDNNMGQDPLLKMLCEDIYVTMKTLHSRNNRDMYVGARQTSQGRQRSYNVGANIANTVGYNDMETDNIYDFTMEQSTATCFASPSMMRAFRDVTQGDISFTNPTDSQSPTWVDSTH